MMLSNKSLPVLFVLAIHLLIFLICTITLSAITGIRLPLSIEQLSQWDAAWYRNIQQNGYVFFADRQSNVGFFPLFPYVWRWMGIGTLGISIFNLSVFATAFVVLVHSFKIRRELQLIFLSIPCFVFFIVPYSESLFFLFCTLIVVGLKKENTWLVVAGLFLSMLTRSAGAIFIPALLLTYGLVTKQLFERKKILQYFSYLITSLVATATVIAFQYSQTGVWFAGAKAHKFWLHYFSLPSLPFKSWAQSDILLLDGTALLVGCLAVIITIYYLYRRFFDHIFFSEKATCFFSILYLAGITGSIVMFQQGDLHSINRYIFATPFFMLFLLYLDTNYTYRPSHLWKAFILLLLFWLFLGSYKHISLLIKFFLLSIQLLLFIKIKDESWKYRSVATYLLYFINTAIQSYFFLEFINGEWVG